MNHHILTKKLTAVLVAVAFVWLLGVVSFPLAAQEAPGAIEKTTAGGAPVAKGSPVLLYVLIGVGVVAAALVVFLVILKSYNIVGSWNFHFTGPYTADYNYTFQGSKSSGTWFYTDSPSQTGTYTVDGKNVTMIYADALDAVITGQFTGNDTMTGTWVENGDTWNWTATRGVAPAAHAAPARVQAQAGPGRK
jgi:hypothetical protein